MKPQPTQRRLTERPRGHQRLAQADLVGGSPLPVGPRTDQVRRETKGTVRLASRVARRVDLRVSWLDNAAAAEQFWTTLAQVQAALVIALVLEGRKGRPEDVDDAEFLADIKERCSQLLVALGDRYRQAMVMLNVGEMEVSAAETPPQAVAQARATIKEHLGLSEHDPQLAPLAEARATVQARVSRARRRADSRLLAYGGRGAAPGMIIALLFLLPGGSPPDVVTAIALIVSAASLVLSLLVVLGRWDWLVATLRSLN